MQKNTFYLVKILVFRNRHGRTRTSFFAERNRILLKMQMDVKRKNNNNNIGFAM